MNRPQPVPIRRTWLVIFGALSASILVYCLMCFLIEHNNTTRHINPANVAQIRPFFIVFALAALIASVAWLRFRVDGKIGEDGRDLSLSAEQFQTDSIVALALSEACTIFGLTLFFIGIPLHEFAFFALGTLFVNFAFILPRGLMF